MRFDISTFLNLLGIIARMTVSSEEVYATFLGADPTSVTGYASDARTAILARFRYVGVDHEMDKMYAQFRERSKRMGYPSNMTLWVTEAGEPAL